jgi:hypothetical protein
MGVVTSHPILIYTTEGQPIRAKKAKDVRN